MADEMNKSVSMSRLVNERLKEKIDARKAEGDDSIPSVSNLLNRLGIAWLKEVGLTDEEIAYIENQITGAARNVAHSH
jgi:hypothetical protein